jgi:Fe-S cluster assembly iron-binding protein IscA
VLILTGAAATAIRDLSSRSELPDGTGVRIAPRDGDASLLALTPAAGPASTDEVVETEGVRLFLESSAAAVLRGKVLDARMDERGSVGFIINTPSCEKHAE